MSLDQLAAIVGAKNVREAKESDAIDGIQPQYVSSPGTMEEVGETMTLAGRNGWVVSPRGAGTGLGLGSPPRKLDLVLDMSRMNRILEYSAGDLVVAVEAGARMADIQAHLAGAGQMLALDGYTPDATIGGVIATNTSGPRRFRYGTVRDLIIGITVVLPEGDIAKSGGKVVKNVAGYDLAKLMTGSLGTLGVIGRAIFRLHPRPSATRLVIARVSSPEAVAELVQRTLHSGLVPTALQLSWPGGESEGRVGLLLESIEPSVVAQAATAKGLFGAAADSIVIEGADVAEAWNDFAGLPADPDGLEVKVTCLPTAVGTTAKAIQAAATAHGGTWHLSGAVGNGILRLALDHTEITRARTLVESLRAAVNPGHVTVLTAPAETKQSLDVWGPLGDTEPLMRRVKDRFDPEHILNPGRFVGGI